MFFVCAFSHKKKLGSRKKMYIEEEEKKIARG